MQPSDLQYAVSRASRAANRAGLLPRRWVALPVCWDATLPYGDSLWTGRFLYVVILRLPHLGPPAVVYRVKPDLRLKRLPRFPWQLGPLALDRYRRIPAREVEQPGLREGWVMTAARMERCRW
jgi:hypothetical protein